MLKLVRVLLDLRLTMLKPLSLSERNEVIANDINCICELIISLR
jgi:hypothetical protein